MAEIVKLHVEDRYRFRAQRRPSILLYGYLESTWAEMGINTLL